MARDKDDVGSASAASSAGGQSQRPPLSHHGSDSQSDAASLHSQTHRSKQNHHPQTTLHQQRQHHVGGRVHARVPSTKALHKVHALQAPKLNRRITSPDPSSSQLQTAAAAASSHRRATSEVKLPWENPPAGLPKSSSQSSLRRNRSSVDVAKRIKSADKLKRSASGTAVNRVKANAKSQVHFDLGDEEEEEDAWVDASGTNSPYLSRKGSLINSSGPSSVQPGVSASNSRAESPEEPEEPGEPEEPEEPEQAQPSSPERERLQHKEYLTSRLLRRTPSQGAPPHMTTDMARVAPPQLSPDSPHRDASTASDSGKEELTSRFVDAPGSGLTSQGSFYHPSKSASQHSSLNSRRPLSTATLAQSDDSGEGTPVVEHDDSALVPRPARRSAAPPAETSRTQQKLNLQRASSVLEPGQNVSGVGGVVGASRLIGVGGPGYDGASSRDVRVGRMLERTGMEYLVVRRYQNPVARSLNRLDRLSGNEKSKRIPRGPNSGKRSLDLQMRHVRNVSMPDVRRPVTPKRAPSFSANGGAGSSFDGDDDARLNDRLSGSSLVGGEEEEGVAALLRNLWEKSLDLSASTE